jgi:putative spermidine/putrescine transport system ATP-binding protein
MVRLERVTRRYGETVAVAEASLSLEPGRFLTILGPSGSGKTTILRMIAGFIAPSAGVIEIHGRPVADLPPWRRRIGVVFQRLALFPHLTAAENVAYPLRMRGMPRGEIAARVERYLGIVRLAGLGARRIHELSGGQQQRVAIARALVFEPDLLLLDEPLAALDRRLREDMQLEFRRIQQELGVTTINVTHDQREALVMSDRVVVMDHGRIQQDGTPDEVYERPANAFVAGFLGVTTFLPGTIRGGALELPGARLTAATAPALADGAAARAALRAERVMLLPTDAGEGHEGLVREVVFEGERTMYAVHVPAFGDPPVRALAQTRQGWRVGDRVRVVCDPRDVLLFPAT